MIRKNNYLFYSDFFKNQNLNDKKILVSKTKNSYLIGPLINSQFDKNSFFKRLLSCSIYSSKMYKKISQFKCEKIIDKYRDLLSNNDVVEVFKNGNIVKHTIIKVPGDLNEEK